MEIGTNSHVVRGSTNGTFTNKTLITTAILAINMFFSASMYIVFFISFYHSVKSDQPSTTKK